METLKESSSFLNFLLFVAVIVK